MFRYLFLASAIMLGPIGCANTPANTARPAVPTVVALEASLAASGQIILACYATPQCASVAPKAKIKAAYDSAYNSVTDAQTLADAGGQPDTIAVTSTISALQAILAQLPVAPAH